MILQFRAWDKTVNKMRACYGFNQLEGVCFVSSVANAEFKGRLKTVYPLERKFNEVILMRYTGLKDSKDNEIYEEDIIEYSYNDNIVRKGVVKYEYGCFWIESDLLLDVKRDSLNFNLLGNVYENKDLL